MFLVLLFLWGCSVNIGSGTKKKEKENKSDANYFDQTHFPPALVTSEMGSKKKGGSNNDPEDNKGIRIRREEREREREKNRSSNLVRRRRIPIAFPLQPGGFWAAALLLLLLTRTPYALDAYDSSQANEGTGDKGTQIIA